jgi:septal ring factor EnvC (AmiA/AmiB activator)
MGGDAHIKVLLNQQNPNTVSRAMAYYEYFFAARTQLLASYRETLAGLAQLENEISRTSAALEVNRQALQQQRQALAGAQEARKQAVASLSADIDSKGSQLQQLERDRGKLEELLKAIEEAVVNLKVPSDYQAFAAARGKMPWPLAGKPSNRFGTSRNEGKMRWQGLTIPAREGTPVHAIHHGRVVYADWFRGSGLLLIIDHGDGYMSLYAHNQSLLREVGEWVTAGTPISTVGSSGGLDKPALYFEVRHNGKPTNPSAWCRG